MKFTMKVYYVTGLNFLDQPVSERVYANSPAEAMRQATKVAKNARALTPKTAAARSKAAR
jgi:hypothetical protein